MYAKLVVGSAVSNTSHYFMRDIARLLVSNSPSTANLDSFSNTASVIIDATPAGWTYVGSNAPSETPTLGVPGSTINQGPTFLTNFILSCSCASSSAIKYAVMTTGDSAIASSFFCTSIAGSANSTGGVINPGPSYYVSGIASGATNTRNTMIDLTNAGTVLHLISNPRHITIVIESGLGSNPGGLQAVWEASQTDAHTFYNIAPYVSYSQANSSTTNYSSIATSTGNDLIGGLPSQTYAGYVNHYNATTGIFIPYATVPIRNLGNFYQNNGIGYRNVTIDRTGVWKTPVFPVWYHLSDIGYPLQTVTGVVPIYFTPPQIGNTGDKININGVAYTFFNAGAGFGVAMLTS